MGKFKCYAVLLAVLVSTSFSFGQDAQPAPIPLQSALLLKLAAFDLKLSGDVSIYCIGSPDVAAEMKKGIGKPIGGGTLTKVDEGAGLPTDKPSIIYSSDPGIVDKITAYTHQNKVLSITGDPGSVQKGITLGVGVAGGKPTVLLNLASSKEEGVDWNAAILKIALTVK